MVGLRFVLVTLICHARHLSPRICSGVAILARHSEAASNATNVVAGREEVMVLMGVNRAWKMNQEKVDVDLAERVVMTPFTAKRLAIMLGATLKAYEAKYGKIEIGIPEVNKG